MSAADEPLAEAEAISECTFEVANTPTDEGAFRRWRELIDRASAITLVEVTARLSSGPGKRTRDIKAPREAILSEVERKNTQNIIATMEKLDRSASKLTWVSVALAVVGVLLAALQVAPLFAPSLFKP